MRVYKLKYSDYRVEGENEHSSFITTKHIGDGVYNIRFDDGWESTATSAQLRSGAMKSPYYPTACGIGFMGCGDYKYKDNKKPHQTWSNMLDRCYNTGYKEYHLYGGRGVTVCKEWWNFQNFAKWYVSEYKDGYVLDKDLKGDGMIYGSENCSLIPPVINSFITSNFARRGNNIYTGVYDSHGNYKTHCCQLDNKIKYLGTYPTAEDAYNVYEKEKVRLANELADMYEGSVEDHVTRYLRSFDKHIRKLTINPYTKEER